MNDENNRLNEDVFENSMQNNSTLENNTNQNYSAASVNDFSSEGENNFHGEENYFEDGNSTLNNDDDMFNSQSDSQNDFEEFESNEDKKIHYNYRKSIAVGLAGTLICGAAMGFFFGVGVNTAKSLFNTAKNFSFGDTVAEDNSSSGTVQNTVSDGTLVTSNDDITKTVDNVKNSIVNISIKAVSRDYFFQNIESEGSGSGIIYSQDDEKVYIVTNNHVVEDANSVTISITGEESVRASLVGKDAASDLAVISVLKSDLKAAGFDTVTPAVFGNSEEMMVGESVVAIGNAMGQGKSATLGIISAQKKEINIDGKKLQVLQTDAAINPGNSGGALVNMDGEVIGINTAKLSSSAVEGTGYAIPTNVAKDVIQTLMEKGTIDRAYLGIQGSNITDQIKSMYNIRYDGVLVVSVENASAAQQAGIQEYDIITSIDGKPIKTIEELSEQISSHKSGDKVTIGIVRNGREEQTVTAVLGSLNAQF